METLKFGDIVILKFPFTDGKGFKKRPALIIRDTKDGDIIVCRITSKIYTSSFDVEMKKWEQCGLKLPSVIRIHKIATMEAHLIESKIGKIDGVIKNKVKQMVRKIV